ncbi:MAG: hypothetical protein GY937_15245 [bacterium]|nr:hypothetical protein [bacterium]
MKRSRIGISLRIGRLIAFGCLSLLGCQTSVPSAQAQLSVVVHSGFGVPSAPLGDLSATIAVLVDARGSDGNASLRRAAAFLAVLPEPGQVQVHVVGHQRGDACDAGDSLAEVGRRELSARLGGLESARAGSLAGALAMTGARMENEVERLVVFSAGLEDSCSDVCAAAGQLAAAGIWQDWVVPPEATLPSCLAELAPRIERPGSLVEKLTVAVPSFQVHGGSAPTANALARGRSGDAVSLAPGDFTVQLDLSPAEVVGPVRLRAGESIRVVVVDFPMTEPPLRTWWIEREEGGARP